MATQAKPRLLPQVSPFVHRFARGLRFSAPHFGTVVLDFLARSKERVRRPDANALVYPLLDMRYRMAVERMLSAARFITAAVLLLALSWNTGALHPVSAKVLLLVYSIYAAALVVLANVRPLALAGASTRVHAIDLVCAVGATAISGGVSSHSFLLFAFVLVAAAYRWGLRRTLVDGAIIVAVASTESAAAAAGLTPWPFEFDWFVLWVAYTLVLAALCGVLSERMHVLSYQAAALGQVMTQVGQATGLPTAIRGMLREVLRLFDADRAILVAEERESNRCVIWRAQAVQDSVAAVSLDEIVPAQECEQRLFSLPRNVSAFEARRLGSEQPAIVLALDQEGVVSQGRSAVPPEAASPWEWRVLIGVAVDTGHGLLARLYVLDPRRNPAGDKLLRLGFLQTLVRNVVPVLVDLYLLRGMRARAESRERARLARELHDGVIQSLAGLEMRLEAIRRDAAAEHPLLARELLEVREVLHDEAVRARHAMQQLRQTDVDARKLPYELTDLVERFSRESGIKVDLDWGVDILTLPPGECRELMTIVQEALVNVRRHSGASRAKVRIEADAVAWSLIIEDNGHGFGFNGERHHEALERQGLGPRVIRERVAAMGGKLTVISSQAGTRLDMAFPRADSD